MGQLPVFEWAKAFKAHNEQNPSVNNVGKSIAVDQNGNVYSAGMFDYTVDFDPGPGIFTISADNWTHKGLYLSKLTPSGDFAWAIKLDCYIGGGDVPIALDKDGNIYICSQLRNSVDFDPGMGEYILTSINVQDAFVAKYDPNGNFIWAKQFGGVNGLASADILDVDQENNVVVGGSFVGTVDFDPGNVSYALTSTAHEQAFIVKLNTSGDLIWARQFGNGTITYANSHLADIKTDFNNNIYITGRFANTCDFDPGPGQYLLTSVNIADLFITKLSPDADFVWTKHIECATNTNNYNTIPAALDIDVFGNVFVTGSFVGPFDFDPGSNSHIINSINEYDWYLLKLDNNGVFAWVDVFAGYSYDTGNDIAIGPDGHVYVVGNIGNNTDIDPGPQIQTITTVDPYGAGALIKLDGSAGTLIYATPFDLLNTEDGGKMYPTRLFVDHDRNIYITGQTGGSIDMDPGPGEYSVGTDDKGNASPFVLKLSSCKNFTTSTLNVVACKNYIINQQVFDSTGTYKITIQNSVGCDSIITLNLSISKKFTEQLIVICEGESYVTGGSNQSVSGLYFDTLSSVLGCDSIVQTRLVVNESPLPKLGTDRDLCAGTQVTISPGNFDKYLWQDMTTDSNLTVDKPGVYWVEVTNKLNCTARDSITFLSVHPLPENFLKETDSVCSNRKLKINTEKRFEKYLWSTGSSQQEITINQPGSYWLTVTDNYGCIGKDSITIFKKACLEGVNFPTAFTPNNDGLNDIFKPVIGGSVTHFQLTIFNYWGQVIFSSNNPAVGWNGTFRGVLQETGTFAWTCIIGFPDGNVENKKGTITLIR